MGKRKIALGVLAAFGAVLCGHADARAELRPLVVNGIHVASDEMPDVAAVQLEGGFCSGVLIAEDVVLTAGHCFARTKPVAVRLGVRFAEDDLGETFGVARFAVYEPPHRHLENGEEAADGDIGLIVLDRPSKRAPRLLASDCVADRYIGAGKNVEVYGFGIQEGKSDARGGELRRTTLTATEVSAGEVVARAEGTSACFGDSGGPVYVRSDVGTYLVALVSGGGDVGQRACVGVNRFARVAPLWSWIEENAGRKLPRATCNTAPRVTSQEIIAEPGASNSVQLRVDDPNPADRFTFTIAKPPARGTAAITAGGLLSYTAPPEAFGGDSITIAVRDDGVPAQTTELSIPVAVEPKPAAGCTLTSRRAAPITPVIAALVACAVLRLRRRRAAI